MSEISPAAPRVGADSDLGRAQHGDHAAFERLVRPLQPELHAHLYRMLASWHDADDAMQETLLRAWRGLPGFAGRSTIRTWLYSVATRTGIDEARRRGRRATPMDLGPSSAQAVTDDAPADDISWMTPWATGRVDELPRSSPGARYEQREAVELAFVAALQHLPGNQRAALVLFDVVGFSAQEVAQVMATSTASVNSALQRARATLERVGPSHSQLQTLRKVGDGRVRELAARFAGALEAGDSDVMVGLLSEDVTWSMPPLPHWYAGLPAVMDFAIRVPLTGCGTWRTLHTSVNGQPAIACYLCPDDGPGHHAWSITVLDLADDRIAGVTSFIGPDHFEALGLPPSLPATGSSPVA